MSRAPCLHATAHQRLHACLAEQAHVGCPEFLTEFKDYGALTEDQVDFNNMLQFYRGRNEHLSSLRSSMGATHWTRNGAGRFWALLPCCVL